MRNFQDSDIMILRENGAKGRIEQWRGFTAAAMLVVLVVLLVGRGGWNQGFEAVWT